MTTEGKSQVTQLELLEHCRDYNDFIQVPTYEGGTVIFHCHLWSFHGKSQLCREDRSAAR